jgi:hypothetical protein
VDDLAHTGDRSWFCADEPAVKDQVVELDPGRSVSDPTTVLVFHHRFEHEAFWDGGRLEYSTDNGASWHDILAGDGATVQANPHRFLEGGYRGRLGYGTGTPLAGEQAWTGVTGGWVKTVVDLGDLVGLEPRFRWRLVCDSSEAGAGWWVDDVELWLTRRCTSVSLPSPREIGGRRP